MVNKEYNIYTSSVNSKSIPSEPDAVDRITINSVKLQRKKQFEISEIYPKPKELTYASVAPKTKILNSGYHNGSNQPRRSSSTSDHQPQNHQFGYNTEAEMSQIGRFKYILQMDREMIGANSMRSSPRDHQLPMVTEQSETSKTTSGTSESLQFWKSNLNSSAVPETKWNRTVRRSSKIWNIIKWPLMLVLICGILGLVIHFLLLENELSKDLIEQEDNYIEFQKQDLYSSINKSQELLNKANKIPTDAINDNKLESDPNFSSIEEILEILIKSPNRTEFSIVETVDGQVLKSTTPSTENRATSSKDALLEYGFTSGHQNNFGVPIEEDERILKFLNDELIKIQNGTTTPRLSSTTDSENYRTKVSPTLPVVRKMEITTENLRIQDDLTCVSTSLVMCKGILHYDLTINATSDPSREEMEHFKYLTDSQCSPRASEFICSLKEPECRPTEMGILPPCKRFCKATLEACSHVVTNSELLITLFDCNAYPDSLDPKVCNDPTRFSNCLKNEFKCSDSSCIPQQWKCDNIKDCATGEDEENCKFCEQDEFRCAKSDKCIPEKWRCDRYEDCPDGSDELDCIEDDSRSFPLAYGNARVYPVLYEQNPNDPKSRPYLTRSNDDRSIDQDKSASEGAPSGLRQLINGIFSTNFANFQDSKEIMMTSDSEADYKYSIANRMNMMTSHSSPCPDKELRCISGRCISVSQICDKVPDCPDGADEAMCIYDNKKSQPKV